MTLPRPYRNAKPAGEALDELLARSGKHYDADLVNAFVGMIGYRARIARSA
jgi:HD-GYP domain-containing protein (c-di-GMP phosphodiesterase class II)